MTRIVFLLVCGIGAVNSVLLAAYAWFQSRGQAALNRLFALLVLTFSIRVGKAVSVFFFARVHPVFELVWMVVFAAGGLLFALYVLRLAGIASPVRRLAAVPAAAVLTVGVAYVEGSFHVEWLIFLGALAVDGAAIACVVPVVVALARRAPAGNLTVRWLAALTSFVSATWLLYAVLPVVVRSRWMSEDTLFDIEAVAFSLGVYLLVYAELRFGLVSKVHAERRAPASAADEALAKRLQQTLEGEKAYLDSSLSLQSLARTLHASPQQVSRVLNTQLGTGFNDYVNRLRVEEAVRILATAQGANRKIGSLAFDCGFSSASVFYAAFRKFTGRTPSEHLKERRPETARS